MCQKPNFKFLLSHLEPNTIFFSQFTKAICALSIPHAVTKAVMEISDCSHLVVAKKHLSGFFILLIFNLLHVVM